MLDNKTFYPTPHTLISKMFAKVKKKPHKILEPSAGKGDIVEFINDYTGYHNRSYCDISVIEINSDLQATLLGKNYKLIDTDFLSYSGPDKYDLIIANPPFDSGDQHLLKAIDIMYRGEIVFLLNAETIKNPYTNTRQLLTKKLTALNAEIEYIQNAFVDAERPTGVEVALVYINIERNVEEDLFAGVNDTIKEAVYELNPDYEVSTGKTIEELVAEYNSIIKIGTDTIISYYQNYKKIGRYIGLNKQSDKDFRVGDMTDKMQDDLNGLLATVRNDFWRRTLDIKEVRDRLTEKKRNEFESQVAIRAKMDFTENNIRQFVLNLISGHEQSLIEAVLDIFDRFTVQHCYSGGLYDENIQFFNGWKTNKAFKCNKKVIMPVRGGYGSGPFIGYNGEWKLDFATAHKLRDIDIVMNYFDGGVGYVSIGEALEVAFRSGQTRNIHSTYFTLTAFKKGTLHLTFNDEDILRRFNLAACRGKNFLPHDYGRKAYSEMSPEEQIVVNDFEGIASYNKNLNQPVFAEKVPVLRIAA